MPLAVSAPFSCECQAKVCNQEADNAVVYGHGLVCGVSAPLYEYKTATKRR